MKIGCYRRWAGPVLVLSNKQAMASRLWFLAQTTSRLAVNSLSRHSVKPSLVRSYSVRRFLCTDRKPDTLNTASLDTHVDPKVLDESEETANPPEVSKTPKSSSKCIKKG